MEMVLIVNLGEKYNLYNINGQISHHVCSSYLGKNIDCRCIEFKKKTVKNFFS